LLRAIELNAVAIEFNQKAFLWGRRAAADLARVERLAAPAEVIPLGSTSARTLSGGLDELIARRVEFLLDYQDAAYAGRYRRLVELVREAEALTGGGSAGKLAEAVARNYFKLMAYKDEYEVARLYADPAFAAKVGAMFEGNYRLKFHLAPPVLNKPDPRTGEASKSEFGPWVMTAFRVLAKLKFLRGTAFDLFGLTEERRLERQLIVDYERTIAELLERLDRGNHDLAVAIAQVPERIRGFGHVKRRHLAQAKQAEASLLAEFRKPATAPARAA
jgi:indolepyruvate ferredoxin oxidoreductase